MGVAIAATAVEEFFGGEERAKGIFIQKIYDKLIIKSWNSLKKAGAHLAILLIILQLEQV